MASSTTPGAEEDDPISTLLSCGICSRTMLHPVIGQCGHALGCRACVETFFEENIAINAKKRKVTRLRCRQCGEDFAKPKGNKKLCVDHTLGELCRKLRPESFGANRASTAKDTLTMAISDIKSRLVRHPIESMPRLDLYTKQLHNFLDNQAQCLSDLHFCKCTKRIDGWPEGVPMYPRWSSKSNKWYMSCPNWTPTSKDEGTSCSFFQWVGTKDVSRFGLKH